VRPRIEPALARALVDSGAAARVMRTQLRRPNARAGELRVVVEPPPGLAVADLPLARMRALGARIDVVSRSRVRISASPAVLARVAELAEIGALRFPLVPIPVAGSGTIVSESVGLVGAATLQANGFTGTDVDVAVVDAGFIGLATARAQGEIPANAINVDLTGGGMETITSHGTAVAEQVADAAPGARLHLVLFSDDVEFENAVDYVRTQGIRIANLSVNWFGASYYDDTGPINALINESHDVDGVFWAVGAGNWGYRHWRGGWLDDDSDGWLSFAPSDEGLGLISELQEICAVLNWNQYPDQYAGAPTDLDLYAYSNGGAMVASNTGPHPPGSTPAKEICFPRQAVQEPYEVRVFRASGATAGLDMTIVMTGAAVEVAKRVYAASVVDPAVAHGAFSVGAVNQAQWNQTPPPGADNFSSRGPTNDGRPKPELVAPNRTQSLFYNGVPGTSFSAPVVAGVAALMLDQDPTLSNLQIRAALIAAATDLPPAGYDFDTGWGKLVAPFVPAGPDADADDVPDAFDDCPFAADFAQADANGDGIGDVCQCGDISGDGFVTSADEDLLQSWLARDGPTPAGLARCNVRGAAAPAGADCRIDDWAVLRRALSSAPPGLAQVCAPALPP